MSADLPFDEAVAKRFMENRGEAGGLHGFLGFRITDASPGRVTVRFGISRSDRVCSIG